jgi:pimeloyl-ACP methyl ester carboxylesterase
VHTIDRRGRGESGVQGENYSVQKECEDLLSIISITDAKYLFGHSYGGFVTLETLCRDKTIEKVALYEPGLSIDGSINVDWTEKCKKELNENRPSEAFITFIQGVDQSTKNVPRWLLRIILWLSMKPDDLNRKYELLGSTIAEHAELRRLNNTYSGYAEITAKVLLMMSGSVQEGSPGLPSTKLIPILRQAESAVFSNLDHLGPEKSPQEIAKVMARFFRD